MNFNNHVSLKNVFYAEFECFPSLNRPTSHLNKQNYTLVLSDPGFLC